MLKRLIAAASIGVALVSTGCAELPEDVDATEQQPDDSTASTIAQALLPSWDGCRGTANRVCSEKVNDHYFARNPGCERNSLSCEEYFSACDSSVCSTPQASEHPNEAWRGKRFSPGESIYSPNKGYRLAWQADGNLVLYKVMRTWEHAAWMTSTTSTSASRLVFEADGNLVIYRSYPASSYQRCYPWYKFKSCTTVSVPAGESVVWQSGTARPADAETRGVYLKVTDDGAVLILENDPYISSIFWSVRDTTTYI